MAPHSWRFGLAAGLALGGCSSIQSNFSAGDVVFPPKPDGCPIEVYERQLPDRPYAVVSRLNVHIEKTHFLTSDLDEVMPELKKQACLSGADAIAQIQERRGAYLETKSYYVTAQGIRFTDER
jgi:hypothetical protein